MIIYAVQMSINNPMAPVSRFYLFVSGYGVTPAENQLQFLEICAGSHRITDAGQEYGIRGLAMDVILLQ